MEKSAKVENGDFQVVDIGVIDDTKRIELLSSKVRMQILLFLNINDEMSLTQLSIAMNKSKPALHRHLKKMIELGIIEERREEKVRGSIRAKIYGLSSKYEEQSRPIDREALLASTNEEELLENLSKLIRVYRAALQQVTSTSQMADEWVKKIKKQAIEGLLDLNEIKHASSRKDFRFYWEFVSEEDLDLFLQYYEEFKSKVEELSKKNKDNEARKEKPFTFLSLLLPIKEIMQTD